MTTRKHFIGGVLAAGVAPMVVPNTVANTTKLSNVGMAVPRCHL